jgi:hypothetical protein
MTSEKQLMRGCLDYLAYYKKTYPIFYFRANSGSVITQGGRVFKGASAGTPDIILLVDSIFCGLECKTEKGRQSQVQKEVEQAITDAGGKYFLIRSMEDIKKVIDNIRK